MPRLDRRSLLLTLTATACVLTGLPAAASATDRLVATSGVNAGSCAPNPCKTIAYAIGASASGDRIVVQLGTYNEQVTLIGGRTLTGAGGTRPTIDGGAGTAVTVAGPGVRVSGLRLRGDDHGLLVKAGADETQIADDVFDDTAPNVDGKLALTYGAAAAEVSGNLFTIDPKTSGSTRGVFSGTDKPIDVHDNTFEGFFEAIRVGSFGGAASRVRDNEVSGTHGAGGFIAAGITVHGDAEVTGNVVAGEPAATGNAWGIAIQDYKNNGTLIAAHAVTARNRVFGLPNAGIYAAYSSADSSLHSSGDVVTGNGTGFELYGGHPSITGATVWGNGSAVYLGSDGTTLELSSSIVGPGGIQPGADVACSITTSRGPTTAGGSCNRFQTNADPLFVGPGDYRLTAASPLLDAGDPAAPANGEVDIAGAARAVAATQAGACAPRRDMGAYELVPATPFTCVPPPQEQVQDPAEGPGPGPTPTPPRTPGPPKDIPRSPPAVNVGVTVLDGASSPVTVQVDGGKAAKLAARTAGPVRLLPTGPHTVTVAAGKRGKPVSTRLDLRADQLAVLVATVVRGKLKVRVQTIAPGARRLVSLLPGVERVRIGTAKRATRLRPGAFLALPAAAARVTIGTRGLMLPKAAQLTVLVGSHGRARAVGRAV